MTVYIDVNTIGSLLLQMYRFSDSTDKTYCFKINQQILPSHWDRRHCLLIIDQMKKLGRL